MTFVRSALGVFAGALVVVAAAVIVVVRRTPARESPPLAVVPAVSSAEIAHAPPLDLEISEAYGAMLRADPRAKDAFDRVVRRLGASVEPGVSIHADIRIAGKSRTATLRTSTRAF